MREPLTGLARWVSRWGLPTGIAIVVAWLFWPSKPGEWSNLLIAPLAFVVSRTLLFTGTLWWKNLVLQDVVVQLGDPIHHREAFERVIHRSDSAALLLGALKYIRTTEQNESCRIWDRDLFIGHVLDGLQQLRDPRTVEVVSDTLLSHSRIQSIVNSPVHQARAIEMLMEFRDPTAIPVIARFLFDRAHVTHVKPASGIIEVIKRGISRVRVRGARLSELSPLERELTVWGTLSQVAQTGLRTLGQEELLNALFELTDGRRNALKYLRTADRATVTNALISALEAGLPQQAKHAAWALGELNVFEALPRLRSKAQPFSLVRNSVRNECARAVARLSGEAGLPRSVAVLEPERSTLPREADPRGVMDSLPRPVSLEREA